MSENLDSLKRLWLSEGYCILLSDTFKYNSKVMAISIQTNLFISVSHFLISFTLL